MGARKAKSARRKHNAAHYDLELEVERKLTLISFVCIVPRILRTLDSGDLCRGGRARRAVPRDHVRGHGLGQSSLAYRKKDTGAEVRRPHQLLRIEPGDAARFREGL